MLQYNHFYLGKNSGTNNYADIRSQCVNGSCNSGNAFEIVSGSSSISLTVNGNMYLNWNIIVQPASRITTAPNDNFSFNSNTVGNYALMWATDAD